MDAVFQQAPPFARQEAGPECHSIRWQVEVDFTLPFAPDRQGRAQQRGMYPLVIFADDLQRDPFFQLAQCKIRATL